MHTSLLHQRAVEARNLLIQQPLELVAANLLLHQVKLEERWVQGLGRWLVFRVVVRLKIRVLQALLNRVPLLGVDCTSATTCVG